MHSASRVVVGAIVDDSVHVQIKIVEIRHLFRRDFLSDERVALLGTKGSTNKAVRTIRIPPKSKKVPAIQRLTASDKIVECPWWQV